MTATSSSQDRVQDRVTVRTIDAGHPADPLRARLALPRPGRDLPGRRTSPGACLRHQARGLCRQLGRPPCARFLLPAHGRDLSQGSIKGTSSPARSTTGDGPEPAAASPSLRQAGAAAGPDPILDHPRAQRAAVRLERPTGQSAAAGGRHPRGRGRGLAGLERLDLELGAGRGGQLPRDRGQHRRHGALLLRALRVPDLLQERPRGARGDPVPALARSRGQGLASRAGRRRAALGGVVLRTVVHDQ
jgi:hypothetical protein